MYIVHHHDDVTTVYKTTRVLRKLILRSVTLTGGLQLSLVRKLCSLDGNGCTACPHRY